MLCDVVLRAGAVSVRAHKNILVSSSSYFSSMFTLPFLEKDQEVVVLVQQVVLAQVVMLEMVALDYRIVLVAHQQHMLVVEVEENSHQTQEEMLVLVAPEVVVLVVKVLMPLVEHKPLAVVVVAEECRIQAPVNQEEVVVLA